MINSVYTLPCTGPQAISSATALTSSSSHFPSLSGPQLVKKGFVDYTCKKKRWVFLLAALGFSGFGAYKIYNFPSIAQKRRRISKLLGALVSIAEVVSDSAEAIGVVSKDFKDFLQSESDQIPNSLTQLSKITKSKEFSESVVSLTQALTVGILRGYQSNARLDHNASGNGNPSFLDKVFEKLSSPAGTGFVSVVVGSFARNMVMELYQGGQSSGGLSSDSIDANVNDHVGLEMNSVQKWVDIVCGVKCKELVGDCIQLFVSTAVSVYLDKTMDINPYDEIFAGLTNPNHETKVRDVLVSVCNGAIETLVKTSHQVLTNADSNASSTLEAPYLAIDQGKDATDNELSGSKAFSSDLKARNSLDEGRDSGWVSKVSSTLAVPSSRRLVLDVTGRVTFETVRSFLNFLVEKLYYGIKRFVDVIYEAIVDGGLEVVRYFTAKSTVVATICLSLSLHMLDGASTLVPA